ncbi:MAG: glycosyltransferase family 2 protein, partial [Akkermansia sp.]
MAQQPLISVIIPIYNAGEFLRPCLDSLLRQTFSEYEAILVNDGSTDNSLDVMREYAAKDDRFKVLDFPNGGYGKAMNRGMDAAHGLYM